MSHELKLRIPDPAYRDLSTLAASADQTPTRTAVQLLTHALTNATRNERLPPTRTIPRTGPSPEAVVPPMPAPSPEQEIPPATWAAIVALHARYPKELERLKDGWWEDNSQTETLAALASWRHELDTSPDNREELAYQHQLHAFAQHLQTQPGGTSSQWQPDLP
jgi:hypothetical protein